MNIKYKVTFHSNWHCGSGLSAGADVDALVVKDDGLPFIPGKTLKGLIREAVIDYLYLSGTSNDTSLVKETFGSAPDQPGQYDELQKGAAFFSDATLPEAEIIKSNKAEEFLYQSTSNTAIDDDGIAKEHSLRKTETVVPCSLVADILDVPADITSYVVKALGLIKFMGAGRNRGLGRCTFSVIEQS